MLAESSYRQYNNGKERVVLLDLPRLPYAEVWDFQTRLKDELIEWKKSQEQEKTYQPHYLLFCEHNPVFTLGKTGSEDNLINSREELVSNEIDYFRINRGGDITYHGPGQIVVYPIFDLDRIFTDVHRYIRSLEEVIIMTIKEYGLEGNRLEGYTGVWLKNENGRGWRKICAIGVHLSRWVTMHGLAFNVNTDLSYFQRIIPCGIVDSEKSVTSLEKECGHLIDIAQVKSSLKKYFIEVFDIDIIEEKTDHTWITPAKASK